MLLSTPFRFAPASKREFFFLSVAIHHTKCSQDGDFYRIALQKLLRSSSGRKKFPSLFYHLCSRIFRRFADTRFVCGVRIIAGPWTCECCAEFSIDFHTQLRRNESCLLLFWTGTKHSSEVLTKDASTTRREQICIRQGKLSDVINVIPPFHQISWMSDSTLMRNVHAETFNAARRIRKLAEMWI